MPREEHIFYTFALVMCRHPTTGKWLTVKERPRLGASNSTNPKEDTYVYWLPGGGVERHETFPMAAIRETIEEAGINVNLKGILRVEHTVLHHYQRMRVIFFAEPVNENDPLKTVPDKESEGALWLTSQELRLLHLKGALRGEEILNWARYIENGGTIYPLDLISEEGSGPVLREGASKNSSSTNSNTNTTVDNSGGTEDFPSPPSTVNGTMNNI